MACTPLHRRRPIVSTFQKRNPRQRLWHLASTNIMATTQKSLTQAKLREQVQENILCSKASVALKSLKKLLL